MLNQFKYDLLQMLLKMLKDFKRRFDITGAINETFGPR